MKAKQIGFTLIELMMVMTILGVLAGVGYPSYIRHIQKAHRTDAMVTLVSMSIAMQQWYMENNDSLAGVNNATDLGFSDTAYYHFEIEVPDSAKPNFRLHAQLITPEDGNNCYKLFLTSEGKKTAKQLNDADVENCWE